MKIGITIRGYRLQKGLSQGELGRRKRAAWSKPVPLEDFKAIDQRLDSRVFKVLSVESSVRSRKSYGGTAPENVLAQELNRFPRAELVWCQEEPKNQGAWSFVAPRLEELLGKKARYTGRPEYASTAAGLMKQHLAELAAFTNDALTL